MNRYRKQLLFLCDSLIFAAVTALFIYFVYRTPEIMLKLSGELASNLVLLFACTAAFQLFFHTYDSLWRYAESREYLFLLVAAFCVFFAYEVLSRLLFGTVILFLLLAGIASLWILGMLFVRFTYHVYRSREQYQRRKPLVPMAIIGAGVAGVQLLDELRMNPDSRYVVRCFFDNAPEKQRAYVHGVEVKGTIAEIPTRLEAMDIREVIVAMPSVSEYRRQEILEELSALQGVKVSLLPTTLERISQKPIHQQVRKIQIEDLLGREPVQLDQAPLDAFLSGKTVLVTGGGGSIGSELCRQIVKHHPQRLVIVDIYENNAYDIQQELSYFYGKGLNLMVEIASVRDRERLCQLFVVYRPEIVFHAAAHKHVPLMEDSPQEAVRNNVFGTRNMVLPSFHEPEDVNGVQGGDVQISSQQMREDAGLQTAAQ